MNNNEKDIKYFKNLKYHVIVRKKGAKLTLFIPELSLFKEGTNFEKAYQELELEKEKYFLEMIEMEAQDEIVEPSYLSTRDLKKLFRGLIPSFIKLFVVIIAAIVILATIDDISSTFKYIKRASKTFSKNAETRQAATANSSLQNINIEQWVFRALGAKERYINKQKQLDRLAKECQIITPAGVSDDAHLLHYVPELAFDHADGSFWHSSSNKGYLVIDCKIPSRMQAFRITSRHDIPGMQSPDKTVIEGSNDNSNWEHVEEIPEIECGQRETRVIFIENNKDYRYYKFNFSKWVETSYLSVAELSIYSRKPASTSANHSK